jgi:phage tail sheath protein FI
MPPYLSPGVFVEEQDTGTRPIEAVGTSTAGFVGTAPVADAGKGGAVPVDNWTQFCNLFVAGKTKTTDLCNAVRGFFDNGGSRCYIANIGPDDPVSAGLDALNLIDEIAIIAAPGRIDQASYNALLDAAETMKDRVAILDGPDNADDVEQLTRVGTVDGGDTSGGAGGKIKQKPGLRCRDSDGGYGAYYFPWLRVLDSLNPQMTVSAPPSGHMAGLYALTDSTRGVHKAPANMAIKGVGGLTKYVSRAEHDVLNPAGINVIRFFSREGIRVWGARTVAPAASNWKYLNVRRLFAMIEESIAISTRWVIFEPNDRPLWNDLKRDISAFLTVLHSQGALAGDHPDQAFFVKCDRETNPPEIVDLGQVVVVIGIAPVKPAEFLIIRIGQSAAGTTVETA